ncbi:MAG: hypothetical protein ACI8RT_001353, partial [Candidatus Azotimanducaceae bacterium]
RFLLLSKNHMPQLETNFVIACHSSSAQPARLSMRTKAR